MTYLNHKNKNKGLFSLENKHKIKVHDDEIRLPKRFHSLDPVQAEKIES
jgi:hypothetical protein